MASFIEQIRDYLADLAGTSDIDDLKSVLDNILTALSNIKIDADTINLNTDTLEAKTAAVEAALKTGSNLVTAIAAIETALKTGSNLVTALGSVEDDIEQLHSDLVATLDVDVSDREARDCGKVDVAALDQYTPVDVDTDGGDTVNALPVTLRFPGATPASSPGDGTNGMYVNVKTTVVPYSVKQAPTEATGSAAIATTIAPGYAWELIGMTLHLSAVGASGTFTATVDGGTASYDPVLLSQDMTVIADLSWFPAVPIPFKSTDELDFAWANAGTKTYYLTVWYARRYGDVA